MNEVFYKYASGAKTADIDGHLITQALTAWSWYWMCVEALVILTLTTVALVWFAKWGATVLILAIMFALLLLMRAFRAKATNYAEAEVSEILEDGKRRQAVKSVFDAL